MHVESNGPSFFKKKFFQTVIFGSKCPDESVLINVILPHSVLIGLSFYEILGD